ncbi:hypothetical protein FDI95_gp002 [Citrobacter phage CF1 ERZ-2017]|uniref:Uncharacterized protein n=1 Tax=Citrobacter phage CF1 ERZ-2017 TaxID=2267236 RepID=A0A2H4YFX0_9CAUD|nr:hypothetical protein FDI95_gp002 [Citrobacter phage CF1 ERZ-2017]AUE22875.1 hypothetical protein Cf1_00002 [Citrobacter phage CF1 ERZ-2017]
MKSYNVNLTLFDDAVFREYRIIQRFFDINEAEVLKTAFLKFVLKLKTTPQLKMNFSKLQT